MTIGDGLKLHLHLNPLLRNQAL